MPKPRCPQINSVSSVVKTKSGAAALNPPPLQPPANLNDAILPCMTNQSGIAGWIARAKERGGAPYLLTLLEAIEPLAPVLAQGLLVAQPLANLWRDGAALGELAELLEEPESLRELRALLADDGAE